jgi:hypothetical protein
MNKRPRITPEKVNQIAQTLLVAQGKMATLTCDWCAFPLTKEHLVVGWRGKGQSDTLYNYCDEACLNHYLQICKTFPK